MLDGARGGSRGTSGESRRGAEDRRHLCRLLSISRRLLAGRGDWTAAQKAYADALSLAKHDDLNGAISKLKEANIKGPHWADPLKAWGDVLVKRGNQQEAIAKYDEVSKYAPNWKQLQKARDAAAMPKT
jgi:hypothetical protein